MTRRNRDVSASMMTRAQEHAQAQLHRAIAQALAEHQVVPCTQDAATWDTEATPVEVCHGCPVLEVCHTFALTGAISEGIIGGVRASTVIKQRRDALTLVA